MCNVPENQNDLFKPLIYLALLLICSPVSSQQQTLNDTTIRIAPGTFIQIRDSIAFFSNDTLLVLPGSMKSVNATQKEKNLIFYDSLRIRAQKNTLTKKLYDLVIVSPDTIDKKRITETSDVNYIAYSGKKIRKIEVQRLNVFGSNINNPASGDTKHIDNILNKTHVNTAENIIRKNLLFAVGDTISALTLSDNERILRQLTYINDARIIIIPVSDEEVDIMVLTKDIYSLGADYSYNGLKKGTVSLFDKNIFGMGHEFGIEMPYDSKFSDSPGFGVHYTADNIWKSFINMNLFYLDGLGQRSYGISLNRKLLSSTTKYAGGISVVQMFTTEDLDTLTIPEPLKYNFQDYWLSRSFLINKESVSRIIIGARYTNNNVFEKPFILPESFHELQRYRLFLASAAYSIQKYYKSNLIYSYGRTEDIPYGGLLKVTIGKEINEFKKRTYIGGEVSVGRSSKKLGYFYASAGLSTYILENKTEQGILSLNTKFFSNLINIGNNRIRNFAYINYTRGFNRYDDERLTYNKENGFSGFKNDSINGNQRLSVCLESVLFSPINLIGFRFAFFGFTDFYFLSDANEIVGRASNLSGIGLGIRIRNDNLVFNTFQIRIGFFPNPPIYSKINNILFSGEQLLRPDNFDSGPPSIIPYR